MTPDPELERLWRELQLALTARRLERALTEIAALEREEE